MGMFDEVGVICEECGTWMSVQTKAGDCTLATLHVYSAPLEVLADVDGKTLTCQQCHKQYRIMITYRAGVEPI